MRKGKLQAQKKNELIDKNDNAIHCKPEVYHNHIKLLKKHTESAAACNVT